MALLSLAGSTQTCTSQRAGTNLSRPIGEHGVAEQVRKQLLYLLLCCVMVPRKPSACNGVHAGCTLHSGLSEDRIGPLVRIF